MLLTFCYGKCFCGEPIFKPLSTINVNINIKTNGWVRLEMIYKIRALYMKDESSICVGRLASASLLLCE